MNKSLKFYYSKRVYKGKESLFLDVISWKELYILVNVIVGFINFFFFVAYIVNVIEKWLNSLFTRRDILT